MAKVELSNAVADHVTQRVEQLAQGVLPLRYRLRHQRHVRRYQRLLPALTSERCGLRALVMPSDMNRAVVEVRKILWMLLWLGHATLKYAHEAPTSARTATPHATRRCL